MNAEKSGRELSRSGARTLLIQFLYQREIQGQGEGIDDFLTHRRKKRIDGDFLRSLASDVMDQGPALDPMLADLLRPTWKWARLSPIVKSILRAGACEMGRDTPGPVVIDQYVGLARRFCDDPEIAMINAVLQRCYDRKKT